MMEKKLRLGLTTLGGLLLLVAALLIIRSNASVVYADSIPNLGPPVKMTTPILTAIGEVTATHVIPPPEGYPKLDQSVKTVTPTLAAGGGVTLYYSIEIRNTGAWTATNTTLTDDIPEGTIYNNDAQASDGSTPTFDTGTLTWAGDVGFDSTVVVSFSVSVSQTFSGIVSNTAVISAPLITGLVTVTAETIVTDDPILVIGKTSAPAKPGPNRPLTYTLVITNQGQPATNLPITVTDRVPLNTTLRAVGPDGSASPANDIVTWTRHITLDLGETTEFTFSVDVSNVPSGTVIANEDYQVASPVGVARGDVYTVTIVDPILSLFKEIWPDPPGSNREMTYTLTVLNQGSLATNLVVTDRVPAGVTYERGGSLQPGGVVSWAWPSLDTGEAAQFTFAVSIGDVAEMDIVNDNYAVCSAEGICQPGEVLISVVKGPTFEVVAMLDPIAKKPGGGPGGPTTVTPTLVVRNLGPGNALDAMVLLKFDCISVSANDLYAIPAIGTLPPFPVGPDCGDKCVSYVWMGDLAHGEVITFTAIEQSTIGGEEGTIYTATAVVTDTLGGLTTEPVTGTATGKVTHFANLIPTKSALPVIGPGQLLTYTITVWNSGLSTEQPPPWPLLTDTVPMSITVVSVSDGGVTQTLTGMIVVSWTLPAMSPGDTLTRSFTVHVDDDLISGTQIINNDYGTYWYEAEGGGAFLSNTGQPVTTTVQEVGLIDSYKEVTPTVALPGGSVLTYYVHIVNSSGIALSGVTVEDLLPWQFSTYQFDAVLSGGTISEEDIVSIHWMGDVAPFSSEVITFSVLVAPDYQGLITNTAIISHPDLPREIERWAVAYITDKPVLRITKSASPDPVDQGANLRYTILVENLGQRATGLVVTDTIPANTVYVAGSATAGGQLVDDHVRWQILGLEPGESRTFEFQVTVQGGSEVINDQYAVTSDEGVVSVGEPVVTTIRVGDGVGGDVYLPIILKNY